MHSRQQSPVDNPPQQHSFSRGNCSAYGSAAKTDENWTTISDKAERRRVQNRIAQRAYRQKLKERLQLLERRAADLQSSASATKLHSHGYDDECYSNASSNSSTSSDEHCRHCSHAASRAGTASPPTQYSNQFSTYGHSSHVSHINRSPNLQALGPDMLPYYQDMRQIPGYPVSAPPDISLSAPFITDGSHDMGMGLQYLQQFDMPLMKFEPEELPSQYLNC